MRRFIAITLLTIFGLPFASSLFALTPKSDANLPACCRRNGKHHCMMTAAIAQRPSSDAGKTETASVQESCPYSPAAPAVVNLPFNPDEIHTAVSVVTISSSVRPTQDRKSVV